MCLVYTKSELSISLVLVYKQGFILGGGGWQGSSPPQRKREGREKKEREEKRRERGGGEMGSVYKLGILLSSL